MKYVSNWTALKSGHSYRAADRTDKAPTIVTYSFVPADRLPDPNSLYYPADTTEVLTAAEKQQFRQALAAFEGAGNLIFVERSEPSEINVLGVQGSAWGGWASYPSYPGDLSGKLVLDARSLWLMLHEIGHAVGLKHPYEGDVQLLPELDNKTNTVMSITGDTDHLGPLDVTALGKLYGATVPGTDSWKVASVNGTISITADAAGNAIFGTYFDDVVRGRDGRDRIWGAHGDDSLSGNDHNDTIRGGDGRDLLQGGRGSDSLSGDADNDILSGQRGRDTLDGGAGADRLDGGPGDDVLISTLQTRGARDVLLGGGGADVFAFRAATGNGRPWYDWQSPQASARIEDFEPGTDLIDVSTIDATALLAGDNDFVFYGTARFGRADEGAIRYRQVDRPGTANDITRLLFDGDDDNDPEAVIVFSGLIDFTAGDFLL